MTVYRRQVGKKVAKYYTMDFVCMGQRIKKSTRQTTKKEALKVEEMERKNFELKMRGYQKTDSTDSVQEIHKFSEAIEMMWDVKWRDQADGKGSMDRMNRIRKILGDVPLQSISGSDIARIRRVLAKENVGTSKNPRYRSLATIQRHLANLKTVLRAARDEWEWIDRFPKIQLKNENNARDRVFTKAEELELVDYCLNHSSEKTQMVGLLIQVLIDTGMRVGEALELAPRHINLEEMEHGCINLKGIMCKSSKPRKIPLTGRARQVLEERWPDQKSEKFFPMRIDTPSQAMRYARKALGYENDPEYVLHTCRHTFASRLLTKGVSLRTVQILLGHHSIVVTQRYTHLCDGNLGDAIKALSM